MSNEKKALSFTLIISGDEILSGKRQDRHIPLICSTLSKLGLECNKCHVVGDHDRNLTALISESIQETEIVIVTGGLGPTVDDITREAISEATGISLQEHPKALEELQQRFKSIGRPMSDNNRRQALVPTKGNFFTNPNGTAPGLLYETDTKIVIALPGPPRELEPMLHDSVVPFIKKRYSLKNAYISYRMRFCCLGESTIDAIVREKLSDYSDLRVSSLSHLGTVDLTLSFPDEGEKSAVLLEEAAKIVKEKFEEFIYSESAESLQEKVQNLLRDRKETLSIAESCTGGLLGSQITEIPGSSDIFLGGVLSYNNSVKENLLEVDKKILDEKGAVSLQTASAMAVGVCKLMNSSWGVSITGIAGPGGGSDEKPVGTVCIAVAKKNGGVDAAQLKLFGSREAVRERSCVYALDQLRRKILNLPLHH